MKGFSKNKRGISLIVLVVTIIVMIILAAAIILSLNSSDIIGKANEAKTSSDAASKKAAASVLLAEYELAVVNGETTKTPNEYVKEGLEAQGIDASDMFITEDREILIGLSKVAVAFSEAGVQIGDTVTGYTLSQDASAKTYTTSGKENATIFDEENYEYIEDDPQPATISRNDENNQITWEYFGIDETGNALIVGSVTTSSPQITLAGKGGYLNGPAELDAVCKAMYSSDMGTARSIDLDDVTRVLEYTGEKGSYTDIDGNEIQTEEPLTIGEISKLLGTSLSGSTPDGKDISEYKSDCYIINKTNDAKEYNTAMQSVIFTTQQYWLSSSCSFANFAEDNADFFIYNCNFRGVDTNWMFAAYEYSDGNMTAIRPVVSLNSSVQVAYDGTTVTLS